MPNGMQPVDRARPSRDGRPWTSDLWTIPGLLSLSRIGLAICFPFSAGVPLLALGIMILAAVTDVADGWYARRFGLVTATGAALDPVTDKLFVLTVAITLVANGQLSWIGVVLLSMRELGELPLALWFALRRRARELRTMRPSANWFGKLATALQFAAVAAAFFRAWHLEIWLLATAVAGTVAAASYWISFLRAAASAGSVAEDPR